MVSENRNYCDCVQGPQIICNCHWAIWVVLVSREDDLDWLVGEYVVRLCLDKELTALVAGLGIE